MQKYKINHKKRNMQVVNLSRIHVSILVILCIMSEHIMRLQSLLVELFYFIVLVDVFLEIEVFSFHFRNTFLNSINNLQTLCIAQSPTDIILNNARMPL